MSRKMHSLKASSLDWADCLEEWAGVDSLHSLTECPRCTYCVFQRNCPYVPNFFIKSYFYKSLLTYEAPSSNWRDIEAESFISIAMKVAVHDWPMELFNYATRYSWTRNELQESIGKSLCMHVLCSLHIFLVHTQWMNLFSIKGFQFQF